MVEEKSIIQIIQKMVQDNESEEKIISTLETLGVEEGQAKRLLLIAQADTFTLLKSEIDKLVGAKVESKKEQIEEDSRKFIDKEMDTRKSELSSSIEKEFLKNKLAFSEDQKRFQATVSDSVSKVAKLNEEAYMMAEENKKLIAMVQKDLAETKLKGIKLKRSLMRNILLLFGLLCFLSSLTFVVLVFNSAFNVDYITISIVLALVGTGTIYLSSNM
ncbi:MAG: hypothetical protein WCW13_01375 [archaeon]|jgi:hypothetical protein